MPLKGNGGCASHGWLFVKGWLHMTSSMTSLIDVEIFEHVEHLFQPYDCKRNKRSFCSRLASIRDVTNIWQHVFGDFSDFCRVFTEEKLFKELYSLEKGAMLINYFRSQMSSWLQISWLRVSILLQSTLGFSSCFCEVEGRIPLITVMSSWIAMKL